MLIKHFETWRYSENRELTEARPKPDPVDRPVRIAHTVLQHYNGTQCRSTDTVLLIVHFLQTNITSQMWPSGGKREGSHSRNLWSMILSWSIGNKPAKQNVPFQTVVAATVDMTWLRLDYHWCWVAASDQDHCMEHLPVSGHMSLADMEEVHR